MKIEFHTIDNAPQAAQEDLQMVEKAFGMVPNLMSGLAASPAALKSYMALAGNLKAHGSLNPVEQQVVYLSVSAKNGCDYCMAAHSAGANMAKMPAEVLSALREQRDLPDTRLDALAKFTLAMLDQRGHMSDEDLADFTAAGFNQHDLLDVITIMAQKTMSNYFNHIAKTPLDDAFKPMAWQAAAE